MEKLAYAHRLGLWGGGSFPFPTRTDFVSAMQQGGLAAMEVLARDLKALGLYTARSLSYAGVARRTAYRGAWYAGAAAEAAAPYYRPPCGYPPYPPCY